jgi:hypothetical protein
VDSGDIEPEKSLIDAGTLNSMGGEAQLSAGSFGSNDEDLLSFLAALQ